MATGLTGFIRTSMRREFVWGVHDCALFCADWAEIVTGHDMAATWRGRYDSEAGAQALIAAAGGLVALFDEGTAGLLARCPGERALVGVVSTERGEIGTVRSDLSWVMLTEHGIGRVRLDRAVCIASWR